MILIFLVFTSFFLVYLHYVKTYSYWTKKGVNNIRPLTFAGSFSSNVVLLKSVAEIVQEQYNAFKAKRYYGMYQFTLPTFVVKDMDLLKIISVKDFDNFIDHANSANEELDPLWSKNLLALVGDKWRNVRATLSPAFTGSKMRLMFNLINDESVQFVNYFREQNQAIVESDMKDVFSRVTNDVLASCAFGVKVDSMKDPENDFFVNGRKAFDFSGFAQLIFFMYSATPRLMKFFGIRLFAERTSAFLRNLILEAISVREKSGLIRPDMIHLMLEARRGTLTSDLSSEQGVAEIKGKLVDLTDEDIVAQAMIFHFGGFDTTSSSMVCLAYELAVNPEIQQRLYEEINDAWVESSGKVTYDLMMKLDYMNLCISEALRKWPPLILADRRTAKEYKIPPKHPGETEITLDKGTVVWIPIFAIHRDPDYFPDPLKFDPERFSEENKHKIPSFAYMPFSIGPRNCIAQRFALLTVKTVLFHLIREFEIIPVTSTRIPFKLSTRHVNVSCEGGLTLGFKRRQV